MSDQRSAKDSQFIAMDGNFSLKCERKKKEDEEVMSEVVETKLKKVWVDDVAVKKYDKEVVVEESVSNEMSL